MNKKFCFPIVLLFLSFIAAAQNSDQFKIWNPAKDTVSALEGQAWPGEVKDFYDRLPARAEGKVRPEVWGLSKNSAGLQIRFITNARQIIVRYGVAGSMQMPHMPATGVSGVDLYSKTIDGSWAWCRGRYSFGDTVQYKFGGLDSNDQHVPNREYTLYLPLYNTVKWMEVLTPRDCLFRVLPPRQEKPVIVYGTSIAQGGVASRPGMAWPAILSRRLDRPVVNLAFSGNGRLEKEVLDMLAEKDPALFVLDCLPNLVPPGFSVDEIKLRIRNAVVLLQTKRPGVPILLTDHDGYTNDGTSSASRRQYEESNRALLETFDSLVQHGTKNIYRLTKAEIGQDIETMVDGVHPSDMGMTRYADAYEKKIRAILDEPTGNLSTTVPVTQRRDAAIYDWETRHDEVLKTNHERKPGLIFIGNSITHYWSGEPIAPIARGTDSWNKYFNAFNPVNLGFGWDRIENVLWRVYHGELDSIQPAQIVVMIGTNNLQLNSDAEIVQGLQFLLDVIQRKQPSAKILLMGIFPRRGMESRIALLNRQINTLHGSSRLHFADAGKIFLNAEGKIDESLFTDGLHPNAAGYDRLGKFILAQLKH